MALVLRGLSSRSRVPTEKKPTEILESAIHRFEAILPESDRKWLRKIKAVPDTDAVIVFTAQLDAISRSKKGRSFGTRLLFVLQTVRDFTAVIDVLVSSHPEIPALVWGSVELTMLIVANYTSYFEEISNLFMRFKEFCPLFEEYYALFPTSTRLQAALCQFHASIVDCCKHAVEVLQRSKAKQLLNALHQGFSKEFAPDVAVLERCGQSVRDEVLLAKAATDRRYQRLQEKEAEETKGRLMSIMSISKSHEDELRELRLEIDQVLSDERRAKFLDSVSVHDDRKPYKEACQKRHHSTAEWIFASDEFKRWRTTPGLSVLWCAGKIGSGKTIITASAINHIARTKSSEERIIYFFVEYDIAQTLLAETMVRCLIRQCLSITGLPKEIELKLTSMDIDSLTDLNEWKKILLEILSQTERVFIFIDALDECNLEEQRRILDVLSALAAATPGLKIFLASRLNLEKPLKKAFPVAEFISMKSKGAENDIAIYVEEMIEKRMENEDLLVDDPRLVEEIKVTLVKHADGMFLWVRYLIDDICAQVHDEGIHYALQHLLKDLQETFNRALLRIVGPKRTIVQRVLLWVAVAKRNLTLSELGEAACMEIGQTSLTRRLKAEDHIIDWCENLLHLDDEHWTVQFAHRSIYDFIVGNCSDSVLCDFHVDIKEADHFAGEICVSYLHLNDFKTTLEKRMKPILISPVDLATPAVNGQKPMSVLARGLCSILKSQPKDQKLDPELLASYQKVDEKANFEKLNRAHSFLRYAAKYWFSHTASFTEESKTWNLWRRLIIHKEHELAQFPWDEQVISKSDDTALEWVLKERHWALLSLNLHKQKAQKMLENEIINAVEKDDAETLATFIKFLSASPDLRKSPEILNNALLKACAAGYLQIAGQLIDAGADIEGSNKPGTDLAVAYFHGQTAMFERLLEERANINPNLSSREYTPLQAAAQAGHLGLVRRLIDLGADVNAWSEHNYMTALQAASLRGDPRVVDELLLAGANVNARIDEDGFTAIQAAVSQGHLRIVNSLLRKGAHINAPPSSKGYTALGLASTHGFTSIVECLLQYNADIDAIGAKGLTPLQSASREGHFDTVRCLLSGNANVDATDANGLTALQAASQAGCVDIVQYMLSVGANSEASRANKSAAIQYASSAGQLDVVESLLLASDVNEMEWSRDTALQTASKAGHVPIVRFLIDFKANINAIGTNSTPLLAASGAGHADVVDLLLCSGADVNLRHDGSVFLTALQSASHYGHISVVIRLLGAGADVYAGNGDDLAIILASRQGHENVVKELLWKHEEEDRCILQARNEAEAEGHLRVGATIDEFIGTEVDIGRTRGWWN